MNRQLLKAEAKAVLKNSYVKLLGFTFITVVLGLGFIGFGANTNAYTGATSYYFSIFGLTFNVQLNMFFVMVVMCYLVIALIFGIGVSPVLNYGLTNAHKRASFESLDGYDLFNGFRNNYKNIVVVNFMRGLFVFLWLLLFLVPGIIKAYQWRYANQILDEHPDWDYKQVLEASEELTNNHKLDLFVLDLSFIGWYILFGILDLLTIGLAQYLLVPYVSQTDAQAYHWLVSLQEPEVIEVEAEIIE